MRLEAGNALRFAGLANCIDSIADPDARLDRLELLVEGNQHAWVDRQSQVEQEVMVLASKERLHVCCAEQDSH